MWQVRIANGRCYSRNIDPRATGKISSTKALRSENAMFARYCLCFTARVS
jgi:hypothetical protein